VKQPNVNENAHAIVKAIATEFGISVPLAYDIVIRQGEDLAREELAKLFPHKAAK